MPAFEGLGKILKEHPFFADWSDEYRELLVSCAANHRTEAGEYIQRAGQPADTFYLIRHGSVALEYAVPGRDPVVLETLHEGDVFGWNALVPPHTWSYDVRAIELCRTISMDAACLRGKCAADAALGYELFKRFMPIMAERLHFARLRLLDVYGNHR